MTADDVCGFLALMDTLRVRVWLDGGWAVDACLGSQTRRHGDLDIVIEELDVAVAVAALQGRGYAAAPRSDTRSWNFVLGDDAGHQVDFHVIVLDEGGRGIYGPPKNGESYPPDALAGTGTVNGRRVAQHRARVVGQVSHRVRSRRHGLGRCVGVVREVLHPGAPGVRALPVAEHQRRLSASGLRRRDGHQIETPHLRGASVMLTASAVESCARGRRPIRPSSCA